MIAPAPAPAPAEGRGRRRGRRGEGRVEGGGQRVEDGKCGGSGRVFQAALIAGKRRA